MQLIATHPVGPRKPTICSEGHRSLLPIQQAPDPYSNPQQAPDSYSNPQQAPGSYSNPQQAPDKKPIVGHQAVQANDPLYSIREETVGHPDDPHPDLQQPHQAPEDLQLVQ